MQTKKDTMTIDSPTAWFAALERARRTNDQQLERRARDELRRLGVRVSFAACEPDRRPK